MWLTMANTGVIVPAHSSNSKAALINGHMTEPPGAPLRVGLTGLTVAEHFRDAEGQDVLLFIDNIFRFTQVTLQFSTCWYLEMCYMGLSFNMHIVHIAGKF